MVTRFLSDVNKPAAATLSPAWLLRTPHRMMFFVGAGNVLLAMLWWTLQLLSARWKLWPMPATAVYGGWLHALLMEYLMLPSFIFGFLLTVFPRWMGQSDLEAHHFVPVGLALGGGQLAVVLGAFGYDAALVVGLWLAFAGWTTALLTLGRLLINDRSSTWHARSCFAALLLGWLGLAMFIGYVLGADPGWALASLEVGTFGMLLPVYITVAHRMFPFFAGNVVAGYRLWRPFGWLALMWGLLMLHLGLALAHASAWLWLADLPLLFASGWALYRWWPRVRTPRLLVTLFIGTAWLPISFALFSLQSLFYQYSGIYLLGRAPVHALFIGFFGSVLVAMVTRVTQGHSGRPLVMPAIAWFAFIAVQMVAVARILADLLPDPAAWQAIAACGWLLAMLPWVGRLGWIYLSPRKDGRPG